MNCIKSKNKTGLFDLINLTFSSLYATRYWVYIRLYLQSKALSWEVSPLVVRTIDVLVYCLCPPPFELLGQGMDWLQRVLYPFSDLCRDDNVVTLGGDRRAYDLHDCSWKIITYRTIWKHFEYLNPHFLEYTVTKALQLLTFKWINSRMMKHNRTFIDLTIS